MTEHSTLVIRRIVFWLTLVGAVSISAISWWYLAMIKLGQAVALDVTITGVDRGETAVLLVALLCSCIPIAMWAGGQPLRSAEIDRTYQISMDDITRAYAVAHQADRSGIFTLQGEFDGVRARMNVLMQHPELQNLSPELRVVAAQMSQVSRDLARRYNNQAVTDAYTLIEQCEQECARLEALVSQGIEAEAVIRIAVQKLDLRLTTAHSRLQAAEDAINEKLQPLGLQVRQTDTANVITLRQHPTE